jgi:hypothetical protein
MDVSDIADAVDPFAPASPPGESTRVGVRPSSVPETRVDAVAPPAPASHPPANSPSAPLESVAPAPLLFEPSSNDTAEAAAVPALTGEDFALDADSQVQDLPGAGSQRRPLLLAVAGVLLLGLAGGGALWVLGARAAPTPAAKSPREAALAGVLEKFDARLGASRYAGPGRDSALDYLQAAALAAPEDPRVVERRKKLAAIFEARVDEAQKKSDDAEAAVQLQALLLTDPARPGLKERLSQAQDKVKNRSKPK